MSYEIFNEDCLEGMKRIPDGAVDCIICDPPYGITDCAFDIRLPFEPMWEQFKRILKPCCSTVLFASSKFAHELIASNFEQFKYAWIWVKNAPTNFVHAKNAPMHKFEEILVFSDGSINHPTCTNRRMKYNPQGVIACNIAKRRNSGNNVIELRGIARAKQYKQEQTGYPTDVLYYDVPNNGTKLHPSQKPVDLLEYLIKTYTNEGELVLDATMGSGSTGVAAMNTRRRFIGFELEKNFFEIAQRRIDEAIAKRGQSLF